MKQITHALLILTFLLLLVANLNMYSHRIKTEKNNNPKINMIDIKVGDCYIYKYISSDPFYAPSADTLEILAIKNGYVKYQENDGYINSRRIRVMSEYSQKTDSCNCL